MTLFAMDAMARSWPFGQATTTTGVQCSPPTETTGMQCSPLTTTTGIQCSPQNAAVGGQICPLSLEDTTQMMKEGRLDEAYQSLMDYVNGFELAKVFGSVAECAYELGRYNEVPDLVAASAIGLGPEDQHVLHLTGLALLKADKCEEAYLSLQRALNLRPKCPKIHGALKDVAEKMQVQNGGNMDTPCLWQYQTQDGGWKDMSLQLCEEMESALADYQANPQFPSITTCGREFDFGAMQQRNIATQRSRSIRRQWAAAIGQSGSQTGQVLRAHFSKTVECCQAIAASENVRSTLARQLDDVQEWVESMKKKDDELQAHETSLKKWHNDLSKQQADLKDLQDDLQEEEASLAQRQEDMAAEGTMIKEWQDELQMWEASIEDSKNGLTKRQDDLQKHEVSIRALQDNVKGQEVFLNQRQQDLAKEGARLKEWQFELETKENSIRPFLHDLESWMQRFESIQQCQHHLDTQQSLLREREHRLAAQEAAIQSLLREREDRLAAQEAAIQQQQEAIKREHDHLLFRAVQEDFEKEKSTLEKEQSSCALARIIYGQRQELEFWRSKHEGQNEALMARFGFSQAIFFDDCTLCSAMQRLLCGTAAPHNKPYQGQPSKCAEMSRVNVHRVLRVVNPKLWNLYQEEKVAMGAFQNQPVQRLMKTNEIVLLEQIAFRGPAESGGLGSIYWIYCDESLNEVLLFHGTSASNAEQIATHGFDLSRVRNGLYGRGFYFACEACKSFQYSKPDGETENCIIVARVVLGRPKLATTAFKGRKKAQISKEVEDSLVVLPEISTPPWVCGVRSEADLPRVYRLLQDMSVRSI